MKVRTSNIIIYSRIGAWRLLGPPEAFREVESGGQPCEAKWRSHPALRRLKPLGFVNAETLGERRNL